MDKCSQRVKRRNVHACDLRTTETSVPKAFPSLPAVVAFPAAPSDGPTLAYPSDPAYLPAVYAPDAAPAPSAEDAPDAALDSDAAAEAHDGAQQPEMPDDEQQLPRQIHIQQHLKLHFHNQGKFLDEGSIQTQALEPIV